MQRKDLEDPLIYIPRYFKVLTKADERGMSDLVPMILHPAQAHYIQNRTKRDIILKGRQMGISTGIMGDNSHKVFTNPYQKMSIITHNDDTSQFLMQTVHRFHRNLPPDIRPKTDWKSGSRMRFPTMDCLIHIDSAESKAIGIGETLNIAHLSEVSRWAPSKANDLFAGITQTVPQGGFITVESTAKGRGGLFWRLYQGAKKNENGFKAFFYPWWWTKEYTLPVKGTLEYTDEEKALVNHFRLTPGQIAFRRNKIAELDDLFYQEYAENDVDCWLSSEISVFDGVVIRRYMQAVMPPMREEGNVSIWKDVIGGEKYVVGVDTAGGSARGDYSVAAVVRCRTNEYVARFRGKVPPDFFAQEIMRLGQRYNLAEIGVERVFHGHSVIEKLLEAGYPNLFHYQDYDSFTNKFSSMPGWNTSAKSKPIMIDTFASALRSGDFISYSENLMAEAAGWMWRNGQKAEPSAGGYDDELMAVMIAVMIREATPQIIYEAKRPRPVSYARI